MNSLKLELVTLVNDERFNKATLDFLIVQLNDFVEKLKGLLKNNNKNAKLYNYSF